MQIQEQEQEFWIYPGLAGVGYWEVRTGDKRATCGKPVGPFWGYWAEVIVENVQKFEPDTVYRMETATGKLVTVFSGDADTVRRCAAAAEREAVRRNLILG